MRSEPGSRTGSHPPTSNSVVASGTKTAGSRLSGSRGPKASKSTRLETVDDESPGKTGGSQTERPSAAAKGSKKLTKLSRPSQKSSRLKSSAQKASADYDSVPEGSYVEQSQATYEGNEYYEGSEEEEEDTYATVPEGSYVSGREGEGDYVSKSGERTSYYSMA